MFFNVESINQKEIVMKTIDGYTKEEVLENLKNGGRLISGRLDEVYIDKDGKVVIEFFIGGELSGEKDAFSWNYLNTFKFKHRCIQSKKPNFKNKTIKPII